MLYGAGFWDTKVFGTHPLTMSVLIAVVILIEGKRLKDISDLPLDLGV